MSDVFSNINLQDINPMNPAIPTAFSDAYSYQEVINHIISRYNQCVEWLNEMDEKIANGEIETNEKIEAIRAEVEGFNDEIAQMKMDISELQESAGFDPTQLLAEMADLQFRVTAMQGGLDSVSGKVSELEGQQTQTEIEINELAERVTTLEDAPAFNPQEIKDDISALETKVDNQGDDIDNLESELASQGQNISGLETQIDTLRTDLNDEHGRINSVETGINALDARADSAVNRMDTMQAEIDAAINIEPINNLESESVTTPLAANMGRVLKGLVDEGGSGGVKLELEWTNPVNVNSLVDFPAQTINLTKRYDAILITYFGAAADGTLCPPLIIFDPKIENPNMGAITGLMLSISLSASSMRRRTATYGRDNDTMQSFIMFSNGYTSSGTATPNATTNAIIPYQIWGITL